MVTNLNLDLAAIKHSTYFQQYLRLPLQMLKNALDKSETELSYLEAFIQLISKVNYSDKNQKVGPDYRVCRRGESFNSILAWSKMFHWNKSKTRRYLIKLKEQGVIEFENLTVTSRILIIDYNYFVGHVKSNEQDKYSSDFEDFWDNYHQ